MGPTVGIGKVHDCTGRVALDLRETVKVYFKIFASTCGLFEQEIPYTGDRMVRERLKTFYTGIKSGHYKHSFCVPHTYKMISKGL